jgi:hypothetical protein
MSKDAKNSKVVAVEIENLGKKRVVSPQIAHNFANFLRKGLHLAFYQDS